ncbi:F-box protein Pof3 [Schizosaccharomyces cryophilus OY26]|uniref:F-box protein Pof3 n=1 Tax=Schizosaccharomyces cryophilus (strain OY26 / ATCC MYA-4695 / CBS 11777 / NBRC 106824 / NRRL Y48691) TaxID=653667 RepID=S9W227_SCHCR|nr:F-box protein Pof3 [Schizosaccharomyces cryophilus OY26]EPY52085.1 F-box protein Pof3 [Schizosaccharomyces cryophilus OY26]
MNNYQIKHWREKTKQYLLKRKYEDALAYITSCIEQEPKPVIDLFEIRAIVLKEMGLYEKAQADAQRMINLNSRNARGYLRLAQLLQYDGLDSKADHVYMQGLKYVHKLDPFRQKLKEASLQLLKRMQKSKPVQDIFTLLPREILLHIFQYVEFRTIVRCMQVSKNWKNSIKRESSLFHSLDFSEASSRSSKFRDRNVMTLARYSTYAKSNIQEVIGLEKLGILTPTKGLLRCVGSIHTYKTISPLSPPHLMPKMYLIWSPFTELKYFSCATSITFSTVSKVLSACKKLERLELADVVPDLLFDTMDWDKQFDNKHSVLNLRNLQFIRNQVHPLHEKEQEFLASLISCSPKLQQLVVTYQSNLMVTLKDSKPNLKSLQIIDDTKQKTVKDIIYLPSSLENLSILPSSPSMTIASAYLFPVPHRPTSLKSIELTLFIRLTLQEVENTTNFLVSSHDLKSLILRDSLPISSRFMELFTSFPHLEILDLSDNAELNNNHLSHIVACCPKLRVVNFSNCISITGSGFISLLRGLTSLERIEIINCDSVSKDAIDAARSKGIEVVVSNQQNGFLSGTKRIRLI